MDARQLMTLERYSRNLVRTADKQRQLDTFLAEVKSLITIFDQESLEHFLAQSLVSEQEKQQVLALIEPNCSSLLADFLKEIVVKKDYDLVYPILQDILYRTQYTTGQFDMVIKSVVPLTDQQLSAMKDLVRKKLKLGIREVTEVIDESILGGFIIEINHKVIDASIRHQLQELKQKIR